MDTYERLIATAKRLAASSNNVINRITTTLENSKPTGVNADKFVVALKAIIPSDDFGEHKRYVNLLEDMLRRRTSQFADKGASARFALPKGVGEHLGT